MANVKDFAVGVVVTAPSPSTSGTTATLRPGEGATMPIPPFMATAVPPGQLTTIGTSEKILVTAVDTATDIITFTRAQSPTTAKSIAAGWIIANAVYTDDIFSSSIVIDETLSGTLNGTNKVFTTAAAFTSILVFKNGLTMRKGASNDFTITGNNQITFATAPVAGTVITATYIMGAQVMINGSNSLVTDEAPTGTINGTNKTFTVARAYVGGSLEVFINGVKQKRAVHFTENPTAATFTLDDAPLTGDDLMVNYQYVLGASANADTVDGIHANTTPTANMLTPLDSNAKLPESIFPTQQGWIAPTFQNGWVNYDIATYEPAGYMKDSLGFVHLKGLVKSGTVGAVPVFTLPAGYRPSKQNLFPTVANENHGTIYVRPDGVVQVTFGSNAYVSLSGITFKAEQ